MIVLATPLQCRDEYFLKHVWNFLLSHPSLSEDLIITFCYSFFFITFANLKRKNVLDAYLNKMKEGQNFLEKQKTFFTKIWFTS
jgi:hypothetical protein